MGILKASRHASALVMACLLAGAAHAAPVSLNSLPFQATGTFQQDDERFVYDINVSAAFSLTALTSSWASGGFAPVLTLFGGAGGYQQAIGSANTCGATSGAADAATGFCWDASLSAVLPAGAYTLVLTQDGNLANGDTLGDGFSMDGMPDYTSLLYLAQEGGRCLNVDASQRSCNYALQVNIDLLDDPGNSVPEPGTLALFGAALLAARGLRRRA